MHVWSLESGRDMNRFKGGGVSLVIIFTYRYYELCYMFYNSELILVNKYSLYEIQYIIESGLPIKCKKSLRIFIR